MSWFSGGKEQSVDDLIAQRKYGKAAAQLLARLKQGSKDARLRLKLSDVLVLSGRAADAIPILKGLADEFAVEGYAAKAIAVLKKIEKIEPGRADVERQLAALIEKRRQDIPSTESIRVPVQPPQMPAFGIEEIDDSEAGPGTPTGPAVDPDSVLNDEVVGAIRDTLEQAPPAQAAPGTPVVASPLFSDFTQDELLAVMRGLELQTFQPGDIIITEGEPGDSLFVLANGVTSAWVKNEAGRHVKVREMSEGAFFGEISILTGKPRTATVTAVTSCELLELNRPTLESIAATRPRVRVVLSAFYHQRIGAEPQAPS